MMMLEAEAAAEDTAESREARPFWCRQEAEAVEEEPRTTQTKPAEAEAEARMDLEARTPLVAPQAPEMAAKEQEVCQREVAAMVALRELPERVDPAPPEAEEGAIALSEAAPQEAQTEEAQEELALQLTQQEAEAVEEARLEEAAVKALRPLTRKEQGAEEEEAR